MSHECPDCGYWCYCGGDIDDCLLNFDEDVDQCTHCDSDDEVDDLYEDEL
jgi:hypothetical protein